MGCLLAGLAYLIVTAGIVRLFTAEPAAIVASVIAPIFGGVAMVAVADIVERLG